MKDQNLFVVEFDATESICNQLGVHKHVIAGRMFFGLFNRYQLCEMLVNLDVKQISSSILSGVKVFEDHYTQDNTDYELALLYKLNKLSIDDEIYTYAKEASSYIDLLEERFKADVDHLKSLIISQIERVAA